MVDRHINETRQDAPSRPISRPRMFPLLPVPADRGLDNTWNAYDCNINETVVLENAQYIKDSGLLKAGYNYFVIDGILSI